LARRSTASTTDWPSSTTTKVCDGHSAAGRSRLPSNPPFIAGRVIDIGVEDRPSVSGLMDIREVGQQCREI
jgi:hypothetical protein